MTTTKHRSAGYKLLPTVVLFAIVMVGCKTQQSVTNRHDSVRVEVRYDSIYYWQHDSIYVDRYTKADTVWLTTTKYKTIYKDAVKIERDTLYQDKVVVQTEKYIPDFYKTCTFAFFVLIVLIIVVIVWRIIVKVYLK